MDRQRIFLAIMLLAATAGIGFALYFFFFRNTGIIPQKNQPAIGQTPEFPVAGEGNQRVVTPSKTTSNTLPSGQGTIQQIAQGGVTKITTVSENKTKGLTLTGDGTVAYYDANKGIFYKVDASGKPVQMSDEKFFDVEKVAWNPGATKAVMEFPDGYNLIYDFSTKKQVTLPTHWSNFEFSKDGKKIAALSKGLTDTQNWLLTADETGANARGIEPTGKNGSKVDIAWNPGSEIVAFSKTGEPVGGEGQEIYLIGQNKENFKSLIVDGYGFTPTWFPDGKQLLYSTYSSRNDYKPVLWVVDANGSEVGSNRREIKINTWANKCTPVEANAIVCAVPRELPKGAGFAPKVADYTPDTFYKIDVRTGTQRIIGTPENATNAQELQVTPDGSSLYYRNTISGTLEKMQLK